MEGKINFYQNNSANEKAPKYRGYIEIAGEVHEFAVWDAKNGKGWSGTYKPKQAKAEPAQTPHNEAKANAYQPSAGALLDDSDSIPF